MEQKQSSKSSFKNKKEKKAFSLKPSDHGKFQKPKSSTGEAKQDPLLLDGTRKLTKQERRNRNKLLKAQGIPSEAKNLVSEPTVESKTTTPSVYKRVNVFPTSYQSPGTDNITDLVDENHPEFQQILETSYQGFHIDRPSDFPSTDFSLDFKSALRELDQLQFYQFDYTQPAGLGTKIARTFVTRCLVGDPGITYKYLGLRMFAHPWTPNTIGANEATIKIGQLNKSLIQRSETLNRVSNKAEVGSSTFNLTLINRCFPQETMTLKLEPMFEKQYCSVSWHADSSLDHYSTIAVYHFNESNEENHQSKKRKHQILNSSAPKAWKAALRVAPNAEGPNQGKPLPPGLEVKAPPLVVQFPEECIYYLLDDFNHHHQHSVVAGDTHRYASTHRVSRCEGHTFQYIQRKAQNILNQKFTLEAKKNYIRRLLLISNEIEFEWIRQFYIQGQKHYDLHEWWHNPMKELLELFTQIEQKLIKIYQIIQFACHQLSPVVEQENTSGEGKGLKSKYRALVPEVTIASFDEFIEQLGERCEKRQGWKAREEDPVFHSIESDYRPLRCPVDDVNQLWQSVGISPAAKSSKKGKDDNHGDLVMEELLKLLQNLKETFLAKKSS